MLWAFQNDHEAIVLLLLQHPDIAVNQAKNDGMTPLLCACQHGYKDNVQFLLQHPDIAVNQTNKCGETPLHCACKNGWGAVVQLLLRQPGIDINRASHHNGTTPLIKAAQRCRFNIVRQLLTHEICFD